MKKQVSNAIFHYNLYIFFHFTANDYNDVCLFISQPARRQFTFILFNPRRSYFGLADRLMRAISIPATRASKAYHHIYANEPTSATWEQINEFLKTKNYPFERLDLWGYNSTNRRFR